MNIKKIRIEGKEYQIDIDKAKSLGVLKEDFAYQGQIVKYLTTHVAKKIK